MEFHFLLIFASSLSQSKSNQGIEHSISSSLGAIEPAKDILERDRNVIDASWVSEIDRAMKKYSDNLMHAMDGVSARLSQLETMTRNLENYVDDLKVSVGNNHGSTDGKLRQLKNILREDGGIKFASIHFDRGIRCLRPSNGGMDGGNGGKPCLRPSGWRQTMPPSTWMEARRCLHPGWRCPCALAEKHPCASPPCTIFFFITTNNILFFCLDCSNWKENKRGGLGGLNKLCGVSPELQTI
ncbi:unnamed protein product [Fraxinus pennsylvanica]|uniref:Uncharacterized protein n=1 Tax=Fraxinus pennsylvanica TaxID=56036 RepID=A0AAD1ZW29_9LAMI|nr:unnamed protein product [Fraxinus pennsylvanica]